MNGDMLSLVCAQSSTGRAPAVVGRGIAEWADSPEKLALVWIIGAALLIGVIVLLVKMKKDKD